MGCSLGVLDVSDKQARDMRCMTAKDEQAKAAPGPDSAPRIGLCGGMANNTYIMAKALTQTGADVRFIRDRWDAYAMSQPVWEDSSFMLSHDQTLASSGWKHSDWSRIESEQGWSAPDWLRDPPKHRIPLPLPGPELQVSEASHGHLTPEALRSLQSIFDAPRGVLPAQWRWYVAQFQQCDLLFVCQVNALIMALLSGTPFFICPAGGEFMVAAGLLGGSGPAAAIMETRSVLLKSAFDAAIATLSSTPKRANAVLVGGEEVWDRDFAHIPYAQIGLPFTPERVRSKEEKRQILAKAMQNARLAGSYDPDDVVIFVPSRISYTDKGQDRLLKGWQAAGQPQRVKFILAAWGADYHDFKAQTAEVSGISGASATFNFLDGALSKELLRNFYRGADLVVDQFTLGHYGTSTREAIATGTPSVCWINPDWAASEAGHELAPVISLHTAADVSGFLQQLAAGAVDLQAVAEAGLHWTRDFSSPEIISRQLWQQYDGYPNKRPRRQTATSWQKTLATLLSR